MGNILAAKKNFFLAKSDEGIVPGIWKVLSAGAALCHVCKYDSAGGIGSLGRDSVLNLVRTGFLPSLVHQHGEVSSEKASVDIGFSFGYCRGHIVAAVSFEHTGKPLLVPFGGGVFADCSIPAELSGHSHRSSTKRDDSLLCFAPVKWK